jgi:formyltetrahydrofolate deformylase
VDHSVLLLSCPDQVGIVAAVSGFLAAVGANIVEADQHLDPAADLFVQRVAFDHDGDLDALRERFARGVAGPFSMDWSLRVPGPPARLGILVSNEGHCLYDLLARVAMGEFAADVAVVVSNHDTHADGAARFGVPFVYEPVGDDPAAQEDRVRAALRAAGVDLVVLARYMRILSGEFCDEYRLRAVNIHHSFLPAFAGARPYHQAHARGVKLIGATAHYVTEDLDEGPIIAQAVTPVSHRDDVERLKRKGRDLEMTVLADAVRYHLEHRVLVYGNRTVVFD